MASWITVIKVISKREEEAMFEFQFLCDKTRRLKVVRDQAGP